jgi:transposase
METTLFPGMHADGDFQGSPVTQTIPPEPPRVHRPDRGQQTLEVCCLDQRLPADHPARLIWRLVATLDLSAFYAALRARGSDPGRPAIAPQILTALWLCAAVDGLGNGRKLDRLCREQDGYRWLCGGVSVNYHTLNDFRVRHESALDQLLTDVLAVLVARDVVQVERSTQDGKRIRAAAGASSYHRRETLEKLRAQAHAYVQELKRQPEEEPGESARRRAAQTCAAREQQERLEQAIALLPELEAARQNPRTNKKDRAKPVRVSSTDPEARKTKMGAGGIRPAYNVQFAVDVASGALVGADIGQSSADSNYSGSLASPAHVARKAAAMVGSTMSTT